MTKEQAYLFSCDRCHDTLYSLRPSLKDKNPPQGWIEIKSSKEFPAKGNYQLAHYCSHKCFTAQIDFRKVELEKAIMKWHPRARRVHV